MTFGNVQRPTPNVQYRNPDHFLRDLSKLGVSAFSVDETSGVARISRAGFGVAPKRTFPLGQSGCPIGRKGRKGRDREDALANTRDACATQIISAYLPARSFIAGWRAINLSARSSNRFPGAILCQGDAPEGCGNGITSKWCPARSTRNLRPITFSNFPQSTNCKMANRPTGIMRCGRKIAISSPIHDEQLRISSGAGTRSPPLEFLPGKQRQTAAK